MSMNSTTKGSSGTVTSVAVAGTATRITSSGGPVTTSGTVTLDLATTAVTPGSYTSTNLTVDGYGRITAASNGGGGSGTVTSVGMSVPSFLSVAGSPVTTTGTLAVTLSGTALPAVNGGTGQTVYAVGDLLYASSTTALSKLVVGTNGQVLTLAAGVPTWAAAGGGASYTLQPVRVATTANITLSGAQTIDDISVIAGARVLVKNQTTYTQNGIYLCAAGAWTRTTDFTTGASTLTPGVIVPVLVGTTGNSTFWQCSVTSTATIVIGTTNIFFDPLNGILVQDSGAQTSGNIVASGTQSITIGPGNQSSNTRNGATGNRAIAIGYTANAAGPSSVAIGLSASAGAANSVAIGVTSATTGANSVAIGAVTSSSGNGIVISCAGGGASKGSGNGNVMVGATGDCSSGYGNIILGYGPTLSGSSGCTFINQASSPTSTIHNSASIGIFSVLNQCGEIAFGTGRDGFGAEPKSSILLGRIQTTNATPTEICFSGNGENSTATPTAKIILTNNSSYIFDCDIIARQNTTGDTSAWNLKFAIKRGANAAATVLLGTPTATLIAQDAGAVLWAVAVTADTTNGRPNISVTGESAKTIKWVENIRMTKIML